MRYFTTIIRIMRSCRMGYGRCARCTAQKRNAFWGLMGKSEGKRPLVRPSCRWENNININWISENFFRFSAPLLNPDYPKAPYVKF
jgi:hypothetical protein